MAQFDISNDLFLTREKKKNPQSLQGSFCILDS